MCCLCEKGKTVPGNSSPKPVTSEALAPPITAPQIPQASPLKVPPPQEVLIIDDDDDAKKPVESMEVSLPEKIVTTSSFSTSLASLNDKPTTTTTVKPGTVFSAKRQAPTVHTPSPKSSRVATVLPGMALHYTTDNQPAVNNMPGVGVPQPVQKMYGVQNGNHPAISYTVLGKGSPSPMANILSPKIPLPDVRSSIREDVLRRLPPDVADWSIQNVAIYFKSHGYIHEAMLLEEQEIDGRALLLMSRNDVLTGLGIKLGPALKIYHMHIQKLQTRTDFIA